MTLSSDPAPPPPAGEGDHAQQGGGGAPIPFAPSPCGGLAVAVLGTRAVLRASGALWLPDSGALVAADLHLEKGSAYASRGQMLPPYDTRETLRRLAAEVAETGASTVVLLGDTFHDRRSEDRLADDDARRLRALADGRRLVWVVGNHDADGPRALPGDVVDDLPLAGLVLRHEPQPGPQPGELAGHLHPAARVAAPRGTVRRRCFITDGARVVLPAFGAYAGGLNVLDAAFAGLFVRPPLAGALSAGRVRGVGWRRLAAD